MTRLVVLVLVLALAALAAALWRARQGRLHRLKHERLSDEERRALHLEPDKTVLVEFTTPACRDCAAVRRTLEEVAAGLPGVTVREVDATGAGGVAGGRRILQAPTVLIVGPDGSVLARSSGGVDADALRRRLEPYADVRQ